MPPCETVSAVGVFTYTFGSVLSTRVFIAPVGVVSKMTSGGHIEGGNGCCEEAVVDTVHNALAQPIEGLRAHFGYHSVEQLIARGRRRKELEFAGLFRVYAAPLVGPLERRVDARRKASRAQIHLQHCMDVFERNVSAQHRARHRIRNRPDDRRERDVEFNRRAQDKAGTPSRPVKTTSAQATRLPA